MRRLTRRVGRRPAFDMLEDRSTPAATLLGDLNGVSLDSVPDQSVVVGGDLFFSATDGVHGRELWRSDGTALAGCCESRLGLAGWRALLGSPQLLPR